MLDEFEGDEYYKHGVDAVLASSGALHRTVVYLWQDSLRRHLYGEWDPELFRRQELAAYQINCERFAADVVEQRGWKGAFEDSEGDGGGGGGGGEDEGGAAQQR